MLQPFQHLLWMLLKFGAHFSPAVTTFPRPGGAWLGGRGQESKQQQTSGAGNLPVLASPSFPLETWKRERPRGQLGKKREQLRGASG